MDDLLVALARYDTPTLANAIETLDVQSRDEGFADGRIRCMFPSLGPLVGYAATATMVARGRPADEVTFDALYSHVRTVPAPRIVVVRDLDEPPAHGALWGEVHATIFTALGCAGCITDGSVRDLDQVREIGFRFFAAGPSVSHAYVRLESVGEPVEVGGLRIAPGDLLHADQHGVLRIPAELAAELPAAAERVIATERRLLDWVRSADFDPDRLPEMRARH